MHAALTTEDAQMSIAELEQTPEWNACTVKQQMWIRSFLASNCDPLLATKTAYDSGKDLYAQMLSHQVRSNVHVRAVLNLWFGRSERDAFMDRLQRQIERGDISVAQWNAIKLFCRLKGWAAISADASSEAAAAKPETPAQFHVGDIVLIDGKKCRVNEVNKNGRPVDVDEVQ